MTYEIRPPTAEDIQHVADHMRQADVLEVAASHGHTPLQALVTSIHESDHAFCSVLDGVPLCIYGFVYDEDSDRAGVWLLGTDDLAKHRRLFLKESRRIVDSWGQHFGTMFNFVDPQHTAALRWLKWLGFERLPAERRGVAGAPAVLLSRTRV